MSTPTFTHKLKPLSTAAAHRRTLRRAVALMQRARRENVLLNLEALRSLATQVDLLAEAPTVGEDLPAPALSEDGETEAPAVSDGVVSAETIKRARNLKKWFGAPQQSWGNSRRDAASYLDAASASLKNKKLSEGATAFRGSVQSLERAANAYPEIGDQSTFKESTRRALKTVASHLRTALEYERQAVAAMEAAQ